jgi:uncharacterized Ntn-hydrolase superfamily protein
MKKIEKFKFLFFGLLVGLFLFPIFTLGDSFASFLIQGKSAKEAIEILIEQADQSRQIDRLSDKINLLENELKSEIACRKAEDIFEEADYLYWQGYHRVIKVKSIDQLVAVTEEMIQEENNEEQKEPLKEKLKKLKELNEEYSLMINQCQDE